MHPEGEWQVHSPLIKSQSLWQKEGLFPAQFLQSKFKEKIGVQPIILVRVWILGQLPPQSGPSSSPFCRSEERKKRPLF